MDILKPRNRQGSLFPTACRIEHSRKIVKIDGCLGKTCTDVLWSTLGGERREEQTVA